MLERLQIKLDDASHKQAKNYCYAHHLEEINILVQHIKKIYPTFSPDNLVIRLASLAEKNSEEVATIMINHKKMLFDIIEEEVDLFLKIKVTA